jgi:hypothetical protein
MFAAACGGKKALPPVDIPPGVDEKLIWSSEPQRPGWTLEEPATQSGVMSFVGLSGSFATEQQGRDDAKRNSINSVVSYTGTLVKDKFERARVSFGLDSNVVDPTTSARAFEKQLAVNVARQVKAKKWYLEKWHTPTGVAWRVFLLAEVPQASVDETMKGTARDMAKKAEQQAKEAGDEIAKKQAEKAAEFWKQMQEQGLSE